MQFRKFSVFVLGYNMAVILWGAFVRATGSGAGCGRHWPLCNGEVIPQIPAVQTAIELIHRTTSGLCLVFVIGLVFLARKQFPKGSLVRAAAWTAFAFTVSEALLGAGLVLFELVAQNSSTARAVVISLHLINTFALLAANALAAWWAWVPPAAQTPIRSQGWQLRIGLLLLIFSAATGAIAALGNTLYPSDSLVQGMSWDFSASAPALIRLRIWHPLIAATAAILLFVTALSLRLSAADTRLRSIATCLCALICTQVVLGFATLALLAPIPLQLAHLCVADLVWITTVVLYDAESRAIRTTQNNDERLATAAFGT